jgi:serine/threonine-protein kinase
VGRTCPTCQRTVDTGLAICPHDGTPLGTVKDPLVGVALAGRYLLRECTASRGRFRVYTGEEQGTGRPVLVTLTQSKVDASVLDRFRERAKALAGLDHPSLAAMRDFGHTPDGVLYVVEQGEVWHLLSQELEVKGRLSLSTALELSVQLFEGLDYLHGQGVTHGGLAPDALRLAFDEEGELRLQIACSEIPCREVDPGAGERHLRYPPDRPDDLEADVHAATLLLVEMLTGKLPRMGWSGPDLSDLEGEGERLDALRQIVERGLGRAQRNYATAGQALRDLQELTGQARFGRYQLLREIGEGGMGQVYLARAEGIEGMDLDRLCVIKTIHTNLAKDPKFVERFLAEARVLASLSHGNIVPVYDVGKVGTTFYIAMQYVAGKDLRHILRRAEKEGIRRLPVHLALFIARELANGLAYAHRAKVRGSQGLIHLDVSPHNVLVSYDGEVRLIDFGLVQAARDAPTQDGVVMGKLCYMSPEQMLAEPLDRRTDIFSTGLVLFELLTGEVFFNQPTVDEVMTQIASPALHPPSQRMEGIPESVDAICLRAMAPNRDERYASAADLRDDLAAALADIAPRTSPEEVGAFVRALFSDEEETERRQLSDLSATLPPLDMPAEPPAPDKSDAISLLKSTPAPIQLASALIGQGHDGGPTSTPPSDLQRAASMMVPHEIVIPHRRSRGVLALIAAVLVLAGAVLLVGVRLTRRGEEKKPRPRPTPIVSPTARAPVARPTIQAPQRRPAAAKAAKTEPRVAGGAKAPPRRRRARRAPAPPAKTQTVREVVPASPNIPPPCFLHIKGGPQGATVIINGEERARLPLTDPIVAPPDRPLDVKIVKGRLKAFRRRVECRPGSHVQLSLAVKKKRRRPR